MKKIVNNKTYPANVIYDVFGNYANGYAYYFNPVDAECAIEDIMRSEFDDTERKIFYDKYKDGMTIGKIAEELKITEDAVLDIHTRILRRLRRPRLSKQLQDYAGMVNVFDLDGNKIVDELVGLCGSGDYPVAVVKNGHIRAIALNANEYDRLMQKVAIVEKWEREAKQKVQAEADIFRKALRLVIDKGGVSAMMLQTELGLGYAHANRIIDEMEQCKFISPHISGKKREVYITERQYEELFKE